MRKRFAVNQTEMQCCACGKPLHRARVHWTDWLDYRHRRGAPEIAPQSQSGESKASKRGGKRPGAGRKPNLAKRLLKGFSREAIAEAMADADVGMVITSLLKSKRERTKLETLIFVRDTLIGRPAQNVSLSGGVLHAHTAWRPLASLSDDEMEMLDKLTKKACRASPRCLANWPA